MCRDPQSNIQAVDDSFQADGPFGGKNDNFDPFQKRSRSKIQEKDKD
jgi:hypothetical protein